MCIRDSPKHNDRNFNIANSEHIDPERAKGNIYWDCFHGFRSALDPQDPDDLAATFSDVERQFYESRYTTFIEGQNERNAKIRHTERNRSIPDLLSSRKTCPEETIYQLGTLDEHASAEDLLNLVTEFIEEFKAKYGEHVHVLDWALHLDESTPHIHERHVFDCENKYGEVAPQQEKALEALGFDLPDPGKPLSRRNNRKITFDAACRKMLFEIAKRHGLDLEEEAEYGNRKYLEKQDFILAKQKEQLFAQQNRLDELTLKVNDMETLLDDVSAAAYDKAVEVVTDVVRTETRKEDMRMIEDTKKWVLSPERKAPKATREYTAKHLDSVLDKFLKTMQTTAARLQEKLLKPEVRQKGKEQVKEKARDSVLQLLSRLQAEQAQRNPSVLSTEMCIRDRREEQARAVRDTKTYYQSHPGGEYLWNAKPRVGKTLSVYDFCKQVDAQAVLIVTNRPAIANSWYSDYVRFLGRESGYLFVSHVDALSLIHIWAAKPCLKSSLRRPLKRQKSGSGQSWQAVWTR